MYTVLYTYKIQFALIQHNVNVQSDEEEEVKPFLSAFLQSSVPDDILSDFK